MRECWDEENLRKVGLIKDYRETFYPFILAMEGVEKFNDQHYLTAEIATKVYLQNFTQAPKMRKDCHKNSKLLCKNINMKKS